MPTRVEHDGYCHDRWSAEKIYNIIGVALLVLDVQMKLLQICGPLLMAIVLQIPLCLYEMQASSGMCEWLFPSPKCNASIVGKPAQWNTFLCHKWDTFGLCRTMSHCDMSLDAPVE
jgi:hypothetical protein